MYPGPEVLKEVGRITIAGSRLDLQMALLWHHLDRNLPFEETRKQGGADQERWIRVLAKSRLIDPLRPRVLDALSAAAEARRRRNEVVHQDWVLRGSEGMRPIQEILDLSPEEEGPYRDAWQRESMDSPSWQRIPARKTDLEPAPSLEELKEIERALGRATDDIDTLTFIVASSRDVGRPPGYVHPD